MSAWTNGINQSQTNHYRAATNLYAKGVRTLIMPNAVDVSTIPAFSTAATLAFIHQRCLDYNVAFSNTLNRIRASCPNLTLYSPDFYTLLTNMIAHPANYGLTNALCDGATIDARCVNCDSYTYPTAATNGYGTNYIFWDPQPDRDGPCVDGQSHPATHFAGANQSDHHAQRQQPAGFGQCSGWSDRFGPRLHESGDRQIWKTNGTSFSPPTSHSRSMSPTPSLVVLSAEIPLLLEMAVIRRRLLRSVTVWPRKAALQSLSQNNFWPEGVPRVPILGFRARGTRPSDIFETVSAAPS